MEKKFNYVYIITNLITNKKYIGKHSTNNLEDNYMGSGIIIKQLLSSNVPLKKQILEICESEKQAYEREKYWIEYYNAYQSPNFYNLTEGGEGNSIKIMKKRWKNGVYNTESFHTKQSQIMKKRMQTDKKLLQKRKNGWDNWWNNLSEKEKQEWKRKGPKNGMYGKHHSQESIEKNRKNQPSLLQIYCDEEPNKIFYGLKEAAQWCGLKESSKSAISKCIKEKNKTAGKHPVTKEKCHWHLYKGE